MPALRDLLVDSFPEPWGPDLWAFGCLKAWGIGPSRKVECLGDGWHAQPLGTVHFK